MESFFTCQWLPISHTEPQALYDVYKLSKTFDIYILLKRKEMNAENFHVMELVFRSSSNEVFQQYFEQLKTLLNVTGNKQIPENEFSGGPLTPTWHVADYIMALQKLVAHNQATLSIKRKDTM